MSFFTPVFRPGPKEIMSSLHRLEQQQKRFLIIHFQFAHFSFLLTHLKLKRVIRLYAPVVPSKTKTAQKPYPLGRHTPIWHIYGVPPGASPKLWRRAPKLQVIVTSKGRRNSSLFTESILFRLFFYRGL